MASLSRSRSRHTSSRSTASGHTATRHAASATLTALLALSLAGCGSTPPERPAPGGAAPSHSAAPASDTHERLRVGAATRSYLLHRPGGDRQDRPRPLLLAFHGRGETAEDMRERGRLDKAAGARGMLVAHLEAVRKMWSADTTPTPQRPDPNVDIHFAEKLISTLVRGGEADPKRVYAVGFSNGGSMALRLAAQRPGTVAGAASVSGQLAAGPARTGPSGPVSVMIVYGADDRVRPMAGVPNPPPPAAGQEPMTATVSTRAGAEAFARAAGTKPPVTEKRPGYDRIRWAPGAPGKAPVELLVMHDAGHTWPGSTVPPPPRFGRTSTSLNATNTVLDFLTGIGTKAGAGTKAKTSPESETGTP
ncbi:PHB depolymerase family esterase [Streptomyces sp. NPDC048442]|uniref:alpha/beta hydrolase family esterase n=1 Tax=Streptomyces sp. NPDC048442 TaxID=3154823 RepID=UPI0034354D98